MMFVDDLPLAILFTKAHGEAELQLGRTAAWRDENAAADRGNESHVFARADLDVVKVEDNWSHLAFVEQSPRIHVGIESAREERRWNVEHQHVGRVICTDSVNVFSADSGRPLVENFSNSCFIICELTCHGVCLR